MGLCWSESLAPALLHQVHAERRFAGVIWATDRVASDDRSPQMRLFRKALLRLDGLWVLSRPQVDALQSWLGPGCPPVHVVRFGVDPAFYRSVPYPADPTLVSIGGDRDRDPETLFAALKIILDRRPDLKVVVQSTSTLAAPHGVRKEAFIPHDEVRRLYARASVVALATRPNLHGSGMTVSLEAMSVGRPVVATRTPGMEDYVVDGQTGYLVDPGDSSELAAKVLHLLDNPAAAAAMGERGRSRVLERHTTDTMCAQLRDILTSF